MKARLALAFLALPAASLCAAQRPDGLLGTDYLSASMRYSNVDMGYYQDGLDLDYAGVGLRINKHIAEQRGVGMDISILAGTASNQNNTSEYSRDTYDYSAALTLYEQGNGVFSPCLSIIAGYQKTNFTDKLIGYKDNFDTAYFGGEAGVEMHLLPGLSLNPYVNYLYATDGDLGAQTSLGASLNYWLTSRIGLCLDSNFTSDDHVDTVSFSAGIACHF
ncbi:MAG TPA: outer membrane beta-barrel protein [Opitutales bacterium]|nr:outer membrane beta-barrel protein [Opitutales bacterium]